MDEYKPLMRRTNVIRKTDTGPISLSLLCHVADIMIKSQCMRQIENS